MKRIKIEFIFLLILVIVTGNLVAQEKKEGPFTQFANRLQWQNEGELYWIDALGPDALRFRGSKSLRITDEDWNLLPQPEVQLEISISKDKAVVRNGKIRAEIEARRGRITYLNDNDEVLLHEAYHHHHPHFARQFRSKGSDHFEVKVTFDAEKDEHLYGFYFQAKDMDLSGITRPSAGPNYL